MSRRRRGQDFSHLMDSLCDTTDCGSDLNSGAHQGLSSEQSEPGFNKEKQLSSTGTNDKEDSGTCSYKSTILAGQVAEAESQGSTENSYLTANSGSAAGRATEDNSVESCQPEIPSLMNRTINKKFLPQPDLNLSGSSSGSEDLNRNVETSEKSSQDSRDTNFNLRNESEQFVFGLRMNSMRSQTGPLPSFSGLRLQSENKQTSAFPELRMYSPRPEKAKPSISNNISKNSTKNSQNHSRIFKRLSQEFISSPRKFTEKLVTIIDESESGFNEDASGVNLSRMTKEFRKMCKYIQDESMPDHLNSTFGIDKHLEVNRECNVPETIDESPIDFVDDEPEKAIQKTPVNRFKKIARDNQGTVSPGSPNSTKNFLFLEKYLSEQSSPRLDSRLATRTTSSSDISEHVRDKMKMTKKAEEQLALLDDTDAQYCETFNSHPTQGSRENDNYESRNNLEFQDSLEENRALDEDELSLSLRIELEKQRERCFETARQIQKIEEDAKASSEDYPKVLERYGIDAETECRKTINSLLAYQNCWAKIRQNQNTRKKELSSLDSGIDLRSNSRTLQASKKSEPSTSRRKISSEQVRPRFGTPHPEMKKSITKIPTPSLMPKPKNISTKIQPRIPGAKPSIRKDRHLTPFRPQVDTKRKESPRSESRAVLNERIENSANVANLREKTPRATTARTTRSPYLTLTPRASPSVKSSSKGESAKTPDSEGSSASKETSKSPKNRFFVTPGKTLPVKGTKAKPKTFFPSMDADIQHGGCQRIIRSPHAPGLFRRGFNSTVISPVSMYIRGTDINLIQNVQAKKNDMLLTPTKVNASAEKLKFNLAAKTSTPESRPLKLFSEEKDCDVPSDNNDENEEFPPFTFPKTNYVLPSRVYTIDQSPKNVGGTRTHELLQTMKNRVVIRHERKLPKYGESSTSESGTDSANMSIHVQRSAEKTNYINRLK